MGFAKAKDSGSYHKLSFDEKICFLWALGYPSLPNI